MGNLIALKYFQVVDPEKSGELITVQPGEPCCELPEAKKAQYLELGIIGWEEPEPKAPVKRATKKAPAKTPPKPKRKRATKQRKR